MTWNFSNRAFERNPDYLYLMKTIFFVRFCLYPQDIVVQLEKRCRLRKIQILSHQYLVGESFRICLFNSLSIKAFCLCILRRYHDQVILLMYMLFRFSMVFLFIAKFLFHYAIVFGDLSGSMGWHAIAAQWPWSPTNAVIVSSSPAHDGFISGGKWLVCQQTVDGTSLLPLGTTQSPPTTMLILSAYMKYS